MPAPDCQQRQRDNGEHVERWYAQIEETAPRWPSPDHSPPKMETATLSTGYPALRNHRDRFNHRQGRLEDLVEKWKDRISRPGPHDCEPRSACYEQPDPDADAGRHRDCRPLGPAPRHDQNGEHKRHTVERHGEFESRRKADRNPAVAAHIIARIGEARARLGIATAATASPLRTSADMRLSIKVVPLSAMATAPVRPSAASTTAAGPDRRAGSGGTVLASR